jgi:hypothetical protein
VIPPMIAITIKMQISNSWISSSSSIWLLTPFKSVVFARALIELHFVNFAV